MCYHNNITTEKVCDSSYPALPEFNIAQFMGNTCKLAAITYVNVGYSYLFILPNKLTVIFTISSYCTLI